MLNNEPKEGEIRSGKEIGRHCRHKWKYEKCKDCGRGKWVRIDYHAERCRSCAMRKLAKGRVGPLHARWKGRYKDNHGYWCVTIYPENKFYCMARKEKNKLSSGRRILESRLIMAQYLDRALKSWEEVHHDSEDKSNNQLSNLILTTRHEHPTKYRHGYKRGFREGYRDGLLKALC